MLCTDCFETSEPQTLLPGSDRLELAAWLCLALPGWLYCAWRHALRIKACGVCGGFALVREARASAGAARVVPPARIRSLRGPLRWPAPFATPRERLYAGAPGALAALTALPAGVLAGAHAAPIPVWGSLACLAGGLTLAWLLRSVPPWLHLRARSRACRAWLPDGREIHIELA